MENEQELMKLAAKIHDSGDADLAMKVGILAFNSLTKKVNELKKKIEEKENSND